MNILTLPLCNFTNMENLTLLHLERVKLLNLFTNFQFQLVVFMQNLHSKSGLKQLFGGQRVLKFHVQFTRNPMEQSYLSKNSINPKRNIFLKHPVV